MKIIPAGKRSEADRKKDYRDRGGERLRTIDRERKRKSREQAIPEFIGVDSEGIGRGKNHRVVLLGVGEEQYIAKDLSKGLHWQEVFGFLYSQFQAHPNAAFVGFYLGYDFNRWLATLPQKVAHMLLTEQGKNMRKRADNKGRHYFPVRHDGWEFDMLGFKRLSIRPWCGHLPQEKCTCKPKPWMHICDSGPFYQMDFKSVLNPAMWDADPDGPVCTQEQWDIIFTGKERRAHAELDDEMMYYNRLENVLLARVMIRLAKGFKKIGISLGRDQWYGPGAAASIWLRMNGAPKKTQLTDLGMPDWFIEACLKSYYGGWFELFSHGLILGESWNYDINNAYPYATCKLPHICGDCRVSRGNGEYKDSGSYVLVQATVFTKGTRIGAVPYRDRKGSILRPSVSKGWYWIHEIRAAQRAGLVLQVMQYEWVEFIPCGHDGPFGDIRDLYDERLRVGKSSAQGLAIKLTNNSLYGKFAQSVGSAPFGNWFYSSYITSHCRTQILDAIASHPGKADSVLMVATDGICFDSRHPGLAISKNLGDWEETIYQDLCLFKPGVYWHRTGKERLTKIKSRGVPKKAFLESTGAMEILFKEFLRDHSAPGTPVIRDALISELGEHIGWLMTNKSWPRFAAEVSFRMRSCKQALIEHNWEGAGEVQEKFPLWQNSDPESKRCKPVYNPKKHRIDSSIHMFKASEAETKYYLDPSIEYPSSPVELIGYDFDGDAIDSVGTAIATLRADEDKESEWEIIWG